VIRGREEVREERFQVSGKAAEKSFQLCLESAEGGKPETFLPSSLNSELSSVLKPETRNLKPPLVFSALNTPLPSPLNAELCFPIWPETCLP